MSEMILGIGEIRVVPPLPSVQIADVSLGESGFGQTASATVTITSSGAESGILSWSGADGASNWSGFIPQ